MTSYDGQTITYDAIGNPLQYRDGMTFTWQGRELLSVTKDGKTVNYTYDSNGQRISKTVDGETTAYYVVDGVRIGEHKAGRDILYMHDEKGDIYGINYDGITHYFVQNVQGDIIGILNKAGTLVAKYEYDAWGNVTAIPVAEDGCGHSVDSPDHIAYVNPFRYRGYYYDAETGFYWLQSRYYDPEVGRFLNSDSSLGANQDLQSYNMFAYCSNNPINYSDPTGQWKMPNWLKVTIGVGVIAGLTAATVLTGGTVGVICGFALAGSVIGGTVGAVSGYKSGGWSGAATGFMTGTISGAASGALAGSGAGYITQAICGGLINATSGVVKSTENMKKVQVKPLAVDFAGDFAVGAISGLIGGRGILNKKESLSAAMNTFDRIAAREIRRKNAIYSAKIIKSAMYDYQHAWIKNGIISGARYGSSVAFVEIYDAVAGG